MRKRAKTKSSTRKEEDDDEEDEQEDTGIGPGLRDSFGYWPRTHRGSLPWVTSSCLEWVTSALLCHAVPCCIIKPSTQVANPSIFKPGFRTQGFKGRSGCDPSPLIVIVIIRLGSRLTHKRTEHLQREDSTGTSTKWLTSVRSPRCSGSRPPLTWPPRMAA